MNTYIISQKSLQQDSRVKERALPSNEQPDASLSAMVNLTTTETSSPETIDSKFSSPRHQSLQRENTMPRANGKCKEKQPRPHATTETSLRQASITLTEAPLIPGENTTQSDDDMCRERQSFPHVTAKSALRRASTTDDETKPPFIPVRKNTLLTRADDMMCREEQPRPRDTAKSSLRRAPTTYDAEPPRIFPAGENIRQTRSEDIRRETPQSRPRVATKSSMRQASITETESPLTPTRSMPNRVGLLAT